MTVRKVRSKNEEKRQSILLASTVLFTEQGYAATSMLAIAEQAKVSKQTVYSHFGNKEDLFSETIKQKCDSYEMVDLSIDDYSDPTTTLLALARKFIKLLTSKEALAIHKTCAYESTTSPQLSELFYQAGPERLTTAVEILLQNFHDKKLLQINNPHFAALQFLNLMRGDIIMRLEFQTKKQISAAEIEEYLVASVALFVRGYALVK